MCKDVSYATANRHCSCKFAKMSCVLVPINSTIFVSEYLQPQMDCAYSQNAICEGV